MTDHTYACRDVPLSCILERHWARRLEQGGYNTVGDVLDAAPEALAHNVMGVGPVRAQQLYGKVAQYARFREQHDRYAAQYAEFYQVENDEIIDEVFPSLRDAVATIGSLVLIGSLFALTVWWLS